MKYYAHSLEGQPPEKWQRLEEHLQNVAETAAEFAAVFGAKKWGWFAGLAHDAGKATSVFQRRLEGSPERVDHSTFGARLARERGGQLGLLLAYAVAGHHGGLPDGGEQETQLHFRLQYGKVPKDVALLPTVELPSDLSLPFKLSRDRAGFSLSFFTRMIFSCLVDADFLDTEGFCAPDKSQGRPVSVGPEIFPELLQKQNAYLESMCRKAEPTPVNVLRQWIL